MTQGDKAPTTGSLEIAERFKTAINTGDAIAVADMIAEGLDVNAQDDEGMTALHHAAAMGARTCIRLLVKTGRCDYLLKDKYGRYASELAYEWGRDFAVGRLLSKKEAMGRYLLTQRRAPAINPVP